VGHVESKGFFSRLFGVNFRFHAESTVEPKTFNVLRTTKTASLVRTRRLAPGDQFEIAVSDSGRVYKLPARVVAEKKKMKSVVGRVPVLRLDVELFGENRPVEGKGKMSIWVTDDERRLPLKARLSHDLGQLDITLKQVRLAAAN
jgi:hypothetical protein